MDIRLAPWELTYLDDLVRHANDYEVARNLRDGFPHPYTESDGRSFIERMKTKDPTEVFAILLDGEAVGGVGLHPQKDIHRKNMELGYWLGRMHWGKGIVSEAVRRIVPYGFETFDIRRIFAITKHTNIGSQRVLEKAGFRLEARLEKTLFKEGEYFDELIYAVVRS